jgi:hypothetical protein
MSHDPDESEVPRWDLAERYPPAIVALICAQCFAAVICVVLALATGRASFLSLGAVMLGALAAAVLTRAMQREAERADVGHDGAKITWVVLERKRNAALAFTLVMASAVTLVAYFPGSEYGIVLGLILLGAVAGARFKYPFGL